MLDIPENIDLVTELISNSYLPRIIHEYGERGANNLKTTLKVIRKAYQKLDLDKFKSIFIFLSDDINLSLLCNGCQKIRDYSHLAGIDGPNLVIQVINENEILVHRYDGDAPFDIEQIRSSDFIYQHKLEPYGKIECFYFKNEITYLPKPTGSDSCFAITTFKALDDALMHYNTTVVRHCACRFINDAILPDNRIFFKPKPEHLLRDSMVNFLRVRLRGDSLEIRPEQNVNDKNPVDVKVSWGGTNHIALIEIKWLGKSIKTDLSGFTSIYTEVRANDGAKQLAEYLDENKPEVPNHNTKGYLVVFDMRRNNTNLNTNTITKEDGLFYKNKEIEYNPKHHEIRDDFAKPIRMFIEPRYINEN